MLKKIDFTQTSAHEKLTKHFQEIRNTHLRELFQNSTRASYFSIKFNDIFFDYSKNRINEETVSLLCELARECKLSKAIEKMFEGSRINTTENRAVLHTALRHRADSPVHFDGEDVMPKIKAVLKKIKVFSNEVISGSWKGYSGKNITDVVNIGIGGSDLGPVMVTEALKEYGNHLNLHFVSNVDGTHIHETVKNLNPETTLFIVVSKTFTTQETMTNANSAKTWFTEQGGKEIEKHFVAVSTNTSGATEFGINPDNIFTFWDWVGGRYSLWSSVGLSIALGIGYQNFEELLQGAYEADVHFKNENFQENIPVLMALLGIWYNNFFEAHSHAILPYSQYMHRFAAYLQQADMESNGKTVSRNGEFVDYETGPIIWGEPGTNGQHAFYQLIHQGTKLIPADFIGFAQSTNSSEDHQHKLTANLFAQTEALMNGRNKKEVIEELSSKGLSEEEINTLFPFKIFQGNKPSNTFLIKSLTPKNLGTLIAFYEHKIFVQGIIWNIYSFDQWGVELGKQLAKKILSELDENIEHQHDASTAKLIRIYKDFRKN